MGGTYDILSNPLDIGEFALVQVGDHFAPEQAGVHDIGLLGRMDLVAAAAGQLEGHAGHAFAERKLRIAACGQRWPGLSATSSWAKKTPSHPVRA